MLEIRPSNTLTVPSFASRNVNLTVDLAAEPLPSRAAMAALSASVTLAYLTEPGRAGQFAWTPGNLSALVAADPLQGVYVAPSSDTTGASGAWVRKFDGSPVVTWFGADATGSVSAVAAFGAAARHGVARVTTIDSYAAMPQAPTVEVDVPGGIYLIDDWLDTGNRDVAWNLAESAVILNGLGKRNTQLLEGRQVRKNRVTRPFPHSTLDPAAAMSFGVGGFGDLSAPVGGFTDPTAVGTYLTMDMVGVAVQATSTPLLASKNANYTATVATFTDGPMDAILMKRLRVGEYVEIASGNGYSGTHRGQVVSWASNGTSVTVTGFFPITGGAKLPGEIPAPGSTIIFRPFTKVFPFNTIGVLTVGGYATQLAASENSGLNYKSEPADADVSLGRGWVNDAVNLHSPIRLSSIHISRGAAYQGFRSAGQQVGFAARGGFSFADNPVGFEYRGAGTGFVSKNAGEQIVLSTNQGGIEIGNQSVASTTAIDSHTSGISARDYDARILFSGGDGVSEGTGVISLVNQFTSTRAVRSAVDNIDALGTASLRYATAYFGTAPIVGSDAQLKTLRKKAGAFSEAEFRALGRVSAKWYQFKDAIKAKGKSIARWHPGYIAQDWVAAWEAEGLDWRDCSAICEDEISEAFEVEEEVLVPEMEEYEAEVEDVDDFGGIYIHRGERKKVTRTRVKTEPRELLNEDGSVHHSMQPVLGKDGEPVGDPRGKHGLKWAMQPDIVTHTFLVPKKIKLTEMRPTGNTRLSLRYEECLVMMEAYHRWRMEQMEARLAKLEARSA